MSKALVKSAFTVGLLVLLMTVPVYGASVNKSISVEAGSESDGETSVNGSISVGAGATVTGSLNTVNGKIRVDQNSRIENASTVNGSVKLHDNVTAHSLETVNGSVSVGEGGKVSGEVEAVNGRVSLEKGTVVTGNVSNVNGSIELTGSEVGGNVSTVAGNVNLSDASIVKGDIIIEKPSMWNRSGNKDKRPEVVIGPGSVVEGNIVLELEVTGAVHRPHPSGSDDR